MRPGARPLRGGLLVVLAALLVNAATLAYVLRAKPHERGHCSETVLHREAACADGRTYLLPEWRDIGPSTTMVPVPR